MHVRFGVGRSFKVASFGGQVMDVIGPVRRSKDSRAWRFRSSRVWQTGRAGQGTLRVSIVGPEEFGGVKLSLSIVLPVVLFVPLQVAGFGVAVWLVS